MPCCLLYFPVPAGEMRNDLYITLEKGEFEKGGKSVARNVEITVYVLDIDGQILKVKILLFFSCLETVCAVVLKLSIFARKLRIIFEDLTLRLRIHDALFMTLVDAY